MTGTEPAAERLLSGSASAFEQTAAQAIESARAGRVAVVDIDGDAAFGKTTALRRLLPLLDGFQVRRSFGEEGADPTPFTLLSDLIGARDAPAGNTFHATRVLSEATDGLQQDGPVAFVIDDLQTVCRA